jgi:hypothetical protein
VVVDGRAGGLVGCGMGGIGGCVDRLGFGMGRGVSAVMGSVFLS